MTEQPQGSEKSQNEAVSKTVDTSHDGGIGPHVEAATAGGAAGMGAKKSRWGRIMTAEWLRNWWALVVLVLAIVFFGGTAVAIYGFDMNNGFTRAITGVFPYPAAMVNGKIVRYSDYQEQVDALKYYNDKQVELGLPAITFEEGQTLEDAALARLVEARLTRDEGKKYGVEVTQEEIDGAFADFVDAQGGNTDQVAQSLREYYNWSVEQFKDTFIRDVLFRQDLTQGLIADAGFDKEKRQEAEGVLARVQKAVDGVVPEGATEAETFESIAKEVSDDPTTAENGGDLGVFTLQQMVPEFANAVAGLEVGKISGVVHTEFGFHIVRLDSVIPSDTGDKTQDQYAAHHILIAGTSLDEYLKAREAAAKIQRFVP